MKTFDCFMYYDEDLVLDLRLNYLNKYVDHFVIVESKFTHSGEKRDLLFNLDKFSKFKDKIIYIPLENMPDDLLEIKKTDSENSVNSKLIMNAVKRENFQRNGILKGLKNVSADDFIIISDVDEIPNLEKNNLNQVKNKIVLFKQKYFYYKFNLKLDNFNWCGSKACKFKNLQSPQWLRNIKDKKYEFWRFDTIFSNKKYQNIKIFNNGGWHFSNIKSPLDIEKKMKTYLHHREFELNPLNANEIEKIISQKIPIYNLKTDMKSSKFDLSEKLIIAEIDELPYFIQNNMDKYKEWLE